MEKSRPKAPAWAKYILFSIIILFYIPLFVMVFESFKIKTETSWEFSFVWYRALFEDQVLIEALYRSLIVAVCASFLAALIGTFCALGIAKYDFKAQNLLQSLTFVSLAIPELVFALALLSWFSILNLNLSFVTVVLSHATFCVAFVSMTVTARIGTLDKFLDEAAHDLGARPFQTLTKVILPVLKPSIIGGFFLSFLLSFDDFLITFYVSGPGQDTLPVKLYSSIKMGLTPKLHALAVVMMIFSVSIILLLTRIKGLFDVKRYS